MAEIVVKKSVGGINEFDHWEIHSDAEYWSYDKEHANPCQHIQNLEEADDGKVVGKIPFAVVAHNEGGHNYTSVCLDCILVAASEVVLPMSIRR